MFFVRKFENLRRTRMNEEILFSSSIRAQEF